MDENTIIIDAHQDIAYNIQSYGRDYCTSARAIREAELGTKTPEVAGQALLGWEDYQRGKVAVVFATIFVASQKYHQAEWGGDYYKNNEEAYQYWRSQIELYYDLADHNANKFQLLYTRSEFSDLLQKWRSEPVSFPEKTHPTGLLMLLEGAEGMRSIADLEEWWEHGLRLIGPVWSGGRFCGGMMEPGDFTREGYELLDAMASLGYGLDISHMSEKSALQALDYYDGNIVATHANARALLKEDRWGRQLTDDVIRRLVDHKGVMGIIPFNMFLDSEWKPDLPREQVKLEMVVAQIDHVCQIAGNANHVGIGTDFDGGFGYPAVPLEINTIADLQKIVPMLQERGYSAKDVNAILSGNWERMMKEVLPES